MEQIWTVGRYGEGYTREQSCKQTLKAACVHNMNMLPSYRLTLRWTHIYTIPSMYSLIQNNNQNMQTYLNASHILILSFTSRLFYITLTTLNVASAIHIDERGVTLLLPAYNNSSQSLNAYGNFSVLCYYPVHFTLCLYNKLYSLARKPQYMLKLVLWCPCF